MHEPAATEAARPPSSASASPNAHVGLLPSVTQGGWTAIAFLNDGATFDLAAVDRNALAGRRDHVRRADSADELAGLIEVSGRGHESVSDPHIQEVSTRP